MKSLSLPLASLLFWLITSACQPAPQAQQAPEAPPAASPQPILVPEGTTLSERFRVPEGFQRTAEQDGSFAAYLRNLPLKPHGAQVKYFDGSTKRASGVYAAVVDQPISARDLQQCADAVMRLRGEYLYAQKRYSDIHFNFLSDGKPRYFVDRADASRSYKSFLRYMDYIFAYANTASLHKELEAVNWTEMQIGDVLIVTGRPYGHAVIVVDMAENAAGEKLYMLAQSYMPAQETQILINPNAEGNSPWYRADVAGRVYTPEWTFEKGDLRRFVD